MADEPLPLDEERLDDVVLALLWANNFKERVGLHRAWKSLPWDVLDRLYAQGLISDPHGPAHSVVLGDEALERGKTLFEQWFVAAPDAAAAERKSTRAAPAKGKANAAGADTVHQFNITLRHCKPAIWRRIQLPSSATFWDLHCAVNDAMGWDDAHLHAFELGKSRDIAPIGIPEADDDAMPWNGVPTRAGWEVPITEHFSEAGDHCIYRYDFGDDWSHQVTLEKVLPREAKLKYPRCLAGARACPPEDCGGVPGYERICAALAHPRKGDEDTAELLEWLGGDFDPAAFDPTLVPFGSAARRLKALLT